MKLSDFDYNLPKELIAQFPLKERNGGRLLVVDRNKYMIEHRNFSNILDYFLKGGLLILNDTKVLTCRLKGSRVTGGRVELLLINKKDNSTFKALINPSRVKVGERIIFNGGQYYAIVKAKNEVSFNIRDTNKIYGLGVMPLPPYIKRDAQELDNLYYQTVYARHEGAIASPTAGLHFTEELIKEISSSGVGIAYLTLHVGLGTFRPVKVDDIRKHKMEDEYFKISEDTINKIKKAKLEKKRIFAVGTTSLRALETYAKTGTREGRTDLFIYPGYKFGIVDCLLTNFHLPRTTLFMLVCAFAGEALAKKAYQEAIERKYRFYSYGDAMLII